MRWKELQYWLKGGILGIPAYYVGALLVFLGQSINQNFAFLLYYVLLEPFWVFVYRYLFSLGVPPKTFPWIDFILTILLYFCIGALIGWLVGRYKRFSKKK